MDASLAAERVATGDWSVIAGDPFSRVGWFDDPWALESVIEAAVTIRKSLRHPLVLVGMGGSSSTGAMVSHLAGVGLTVLDSSHPDTIDSVDPTSSTFIVSSKSGSTIETICTLADALARGLDPANVVVITDPGTGLEQFARSIGAHVFLGNPRTGGRFSATSAFGVVPAILAGADPSLFDIPRPATSDLASDFLRGVNDASTTTYALPGDPLRDFVALWEEQLVAESTGKEGKGLLPVVGSSVGVSSLRDIVSTHMRVVGQCWALGVDPFNQPNVEGAKANTLTFLSGKATRPEPGSVKDFLAAITSACAVAIEVFGPNSCASEVIELRTAIEQLTSSPVIAGIGPRFLHSTGQLLKGGPQPIVHLQIRVIPRGEVRRISGRSYSFHELIAAQADGDLMALRSQGSLATSLEVSRVSDVLSLLA